jgi:poly [ADP-ribose] polymerase 2/3/4
MKSSPFGTAKFPSDFKVTKSASLQCTDMLGGNNKFYVLELHESGSEVRLYSCYGRTGKDGVKEERIPSGMHEALKEFESIVKSKEKKGYKQVALAVTSKGTAEGNKVVLSTDVKEKVVAAVTTKKSELPIQVANLVRRIYEEAGQACTSQLNANVNATHKNPLGTLTESQIQNGKQILAEANTLLAKKQQNPQWGAILVDPEIIAVTNEFYSCIPQNIPLRPRDEEGRVHWLKKYCLNRAEILDQQSDFLDILGDVEGLISGFQSDDLDEKYKAINCSFQFCDQSTDDFIAAKKYVEESQSRHHSHKLIVKNLWKLSCGAQRNNSSFMDSIGNVEPLFHGSGPGNILGISKKGLLMRPPGAYVTGGMFGGSALYFADQSTKSSQYATGRFGGDRGKHNSYFMFIADVALGKIKEYDTAQPHLQKPPMGYNSVKGIAGRALLHNEYMVYDIRQNVLQYLLEFEQRYV